MTLLPVLLPEGYKSEVAVNDKLAVGDTIAIATAAKKDASENIVNVAFYFGIPAQDIHKFLKKNLGDAVSEGELLAEQKGGFAKSPKKLISQFSGTIIKIDQTNGDVGIKGLSGPTEKGTLEKIISPVAGIVDFCNNEKIVIKTDKDAIQALDGLGEEAEGQLLHLEDLEETGLISSEISAKIILSESIDRVSLFKAIGLDANGIIVKTLEDTDFIDLTDKRIPTPVMTVGEDDYRKLIKANGKKVYLGGKNKSIVIL